MTPLSAPASTYSYAMGDCPTGRKLLLLTVAGVIVIGSWDGHQPGYMAWAPLPDRDKQAERERGL